ncbi:hypothetical protein SAMN05443428_11192 [Caloramator quimbayensis]|uniref:Uncharacterized protein n=1 Tax=Caloramator quimbayensis TaxID=1147123 RepID=A0A1T4XRC5_9CLOT|nr:hypothetical protein SAMN05443428_11192 [Caloramator quimbayensis]
MNTYYGKQIQKPPLVTGDKMIVCNLSQGWLTYDAYTPA